MESLLLFPIIDFIDERKVKFLENVITEKPAGNKIIGYVASSGGEANSMVHIINRMNSLKIEKVAYAGTIVLSAAVPVFLCFNERIAFENSEFLIHETIPLDRGVRTEKFEKFDLKIWEFMASRMQKISVNELVSIARKGEFFNVERALEFGLVQKVIQEPASFKRWKEILRSEGLDDQGWSHLLAAMENCV